MATGIFTEYNAFGIENPIEPREPLTYKNRTDTYLFTSGTLTVKIWRGREMVQIKIKELVRHVAGLDVVCLEDFTIGKDDDSLSARLQTLGLVGAMDNPGLNVQRTGVTCYLTGGLYFHYAMIDIDGITTNHLGIVSRSIDRVRWLVEKYGLPTPSADFNSYLQQIGKVPTSYQAA
ncbi:MAG: hypothetical protein EPN86_03845 [Nanoarchaeota archaeon]|nr:MAG: hypothetical protein EPN86_03845 [Nanoarchaeota archaeon]